jgi:hypothetical protein
VTYGIFSLLGRNVLESNREMNEIKIDVSQAPSLILSLGHLQRMLSLVIVVPELGGDEDIFTLHEAFLDGAVNALASFLFILVVVRSIKESVARLDRL